MLDAKAYISCEQALICSKPFSTTENMESTKQHIKIFICSLSPIFSYFHFKSTAFPYYSKKDNFCRTLKQVKQNK